jgi:magnesium transporter
VVVRLNPERIKQLLAQEGGASLRRIFARVNFADLAELIDQNLSDEEAVQCFQHLTIGQSAQVLGSLSEARQQICLAAMPVIISSQILRLMAVDDAVDILQDMGVNQSQRILEEMPLDDDTRNLHHLLREEPDTAAGIMSTEFIKLSIEGTVGDALALIRHSERKDFIYYCYLVNSLEVLVGVVSLKKLILHPETTPLTELATYDVKTLFIHFDQELAATVFRKYYNLLAMPVVDDDHMMRGIVTLDDIIDVIEEETSEDIYRTSGISVEAIDEKNLLSGPVANAVKARLPWLCVTMVGQFVAASIFAAHKHTVDAATIAVSFMPLLSGLSGNMGAQSETISVRGLALNLINPENIIEKLWRELRVALTMGSLLAGAVCVMSLMQYHHWPLSVLLAISIVINLSLAACLGVFLPYAYQKYFQQDPAGVGGPFITTLLDILTFSAYLYVVSQLQAIML